MQEYSTKDSTNKLLENEEWGFKGAKPFPIKREPENSFVKKIEE